MFDYSFGYSYSWCAFSLHYLVLLTKCLLWLARGNLVVKRQPLIPRILSVSEAAAIARKPFKPPCEKGYRNCNEELARRLLARKRFVPWGSGQPLTPICNLLPQLPVSSTREDSLEKSEELPPGVEPLILWHSEESDKENDIDSTMIVVDPLLVRYLRPHQRYFLRNQPHKKEKANMRQNKAKEI